MDVTLGTLYEYPLLSSFLTGFPLWNTRNTTVLLQAIAVTGKSKGLGGRTWFQPHLLALFLLDSSWRYSLSVVTCGLLICAICCPADITEESHAGWMNHGACRNKLCYHPGPCWLSTGVSSHGLWIICEPCMTLLEARMEQVEHWKNFCFLMVVILSL